MSGSGETTHYSAPAVRVLNTDAGAPPAREGMRQATRAAGADSGMRVCRIGPGADKDGTRCTGGRRGGARNISERGRRRGQVRLTEAPRPELWADNKGVIEA